MGEKTGQIGRVAIFILAIEGLKWGNWKERSPVLTIPTTFCGALRRM
jgi:hypothetical protein